MRIPPSSTPESLPCHLQRRISGRVHVRARSRSCLWEPMDSRLSGRFSGTRVTRRAAGIPREQAGQPTSMLRCTSVAPCTTVDRT